MSNRKREQAFRARSDRHAAVGRQRQALSGWAVTGDVLSG